VFDPVDAQVVIILGEDGERVEELEDDDELEEEPQPQRVPVALRVAGGVVEAGGRQFDLPDVLLLALLRRVGLHVHFQPALAS